MPHKNAQLESKRLRIMVVAPELTDESDQELHSPGEVARSRTLRIGLLEGGYNLVAVVPADVHLPERVRQIQPDMIIVDSQSNARDILEHVVVATRDEPRPVVMFTEDDAPKNMQAAIAAGVSAYVVAGLAPERIRPVLQVAMARFEHDQKLRTELAQAKDALQERKLIDKAKSILINRNGLTEEQAHARLQKLAMDKGLKLPQVAQRIIDAADLLG